MNLSSKILDFVGRNPEKTKGMILFGLPGAGKGTYGSYLSKDFNLLKIAPGDLIRKQLKSPSLKTDPLTLQLKSQVEKGKLVSDEVAMDIVWKEYEMQKVKFKGVIFDGIPRTLLQVNLLKQHFDLSKFLLVNIILREDILIEKLMGRRVCNGCGRNYNLCTISKDGYEMDPLLPEKGQNCDDCPGTLILREDDRENIVKDRIEIYKKETLPVMASLLKLLEIKIDFEPKRGINDYPILKKRIEGVWK